MKYIAHNCLHKEMCKLALYFRQCTGMTLDEYSKVVGYHALTIQRQENITIYPVDLCYRAKLAGYDSIYRCKKPDFSPRTFKSPEEGVKIVMTDNCLSKGKLSNMANYSPQSVDFLLAPDHRTNMGYFYEIFRRLGYSFNLDFYCCVDSITLTIVK